MEDQGIPHERWPYSHLFADRDEITFGQFKGEVVRKSRLPVVFGFLD